jgi:hypothetical protein
MKEIMGILFSENGIPNDTPPGPFLVLIVLIWGVDLLRKRAARKKAENNTPHPTPLV